MRKLKKKKKKGPTKGTCEKMVPPGLLVWPKFQLTYVTLVIFFLRKWQVQNHIQASNLIMGNSFVGF